MQWRVFLWAVVIATALLQVLATHHYRNLLQRWQQQEKISTALHQEYSRLVLERSTLGAHNRIDRVARSQLNMTDAKHIQVLQK